jgi:hypothetical protein
MMNFLLILTLSIVLAPLALSAEKEHHDELLVYLTSSRKGDTKTSEIFTVKPPDGKARRVYFDQDLTTHLQPDYVLPVVGGRRVFALLAAPNAHVEYDTKTQAMKPGGYLIAELDLDGSNRFRKVFEPQGEQVIRHLAANATGGKLAYVNESGRHDGQRLRWLFIHNADTGALQTRVNLSRICVECIVETIGWLDEQHLYVTLDVPPAGLKAEDTEKRSGIYLIAEMDGHATKLTHDLLALTHDPTYEPRVTGPTAIGALSDGTLVVHDHLTRPGQRCAPMFLQTLDLSKQSSHSIRVDTTCSTNPRLARSARWVAFTQWVPGDSPDLVHLWIKDMVSGKETRYLSSKRTDSVLRSLAPIGWLQASP